MNEKVNPDIDKVVEAAWRAREHSYSPYSGFAVGSAVLTKKGLIYSGCNVENVSFGLTICAERVAVQNAISNGDMEIVVVAIVSDSDVLTPPCGACRQVLFEFRCELGVNAADSPETLIVIENKQGRRAFHTLNELLPFPFSSENLP